MVNYTPVTKYKILEEKKTTLNDSHLISQNMLENLYDNVQYNII